MAFSSSGPNPYQKPTTRGDSIVHTVIAEMRSPAVAIASGAAPANCSSFIPLLYVGFAPSRGRFNHLVIATREIPSVMTCPATGRATRTFALGRTALLRAGRYPVGPLPMPP